MMQKKIKKFFNTVSISDKLPFVTIEEHKKEKAPWAFIAGALFGAALVCGVLKLLLNSTEKENA